MYFGALAIGADCAAGLLTMARIKAVKPREINLLFKDFKAQFLKRPEGDVLFRCDAGGQIDSQIMEVLKSGKRITAPIKVTAFSRDEIDPVAEFTLGLSLKASSK